MDRERFSDVSEDNHHPLVTSSEPENGKDPPRVKREMPQEREINLAQQQQQQYEGTQPMYPSSCPPRRYGVGAKSGIVVPTKSNEERNLMEPSQSVKEETGVTMAGTESEDETVTGDLENTGEMKPTSTPKPGKGESSDTFYKDISTVFSPLVPRVEIWWGPSMVSSVPAVQRASVLITENFVRNGLERTDQSHSTERWSEEGNYFQYDSLTLEDIIGINHKHWSVSGGEPARHGRLEEREEMGGTRKSHENESDNHGSHGTVVGLKSTPANTPHAPRVDTWWGLQEVGVVPTSQSQAESNREYKGERDQGEPAMRARESLWYDWVEEERRSTSLLRSLTEPNNQAGQGTGLGLTMLAPNISSHAPRVDTGWGLSPVIIVPIHDGTELTTGDQETEQLGGPVEEQLDRGLVELEDDIFAMDQFKDTVEEDLQNDSSLVELEDDKIMTPGTGRTWPPQRTMTHIPYFPYMVRSVVAPKAPKESLSSKARQAQRKRKFYWRRKRRRRRAANKEESQEGAQILTIPRQETCSITCEALGGSNSNPTVKSVHIPHVYHKQKTVGKAFSDTMANKLTTDPIDAMMDAIAEDERRTLAVEETNTAQASQAEQTPKPSGSGGSNQEAVRPQAEKEKPEKMEKKGKQPAKKTRKQLNCTVANCDYVVGYKAKLWNHLEYVHGITKDRKLPAPASMSTPASNSSGDSANNTVCVSSDASPELLAVITNKKRKNEDELVDSRELRRKIENLQKEMKEATEKGEKSKHLEPENMTDQLVDAYGKIKNLEKQLSTQLQETREFKNKTTSLEMERDALRKEIDNWRSKANTFLTNANETENLKLDLKSKMEEITRWRDVGEKQYGMLADVKRSLVEAKERVKFLESRQVCRDFTEGRCRRGQSCKFAHVLSTTMREDTGRQMTANTQPSQPGPATPSGFGAVGGQGLYQPSGEEGNCIHFERGYCKFGNTCEKTHDPTKYATRPRSGSHGSNQGFRGRSRPTVGTLGAIAETGSPQRLPEMNPTAMTREQMMEEVRRLDEMARGRHGISEEIMLNQIREMRNSNILSGMMTTEQVQKAFPSKRD